MICESKLFIGVDFVEEKIGWSKSKENLVECTRKLYIEQSFCNFTLKAFILLFKNYKSGFKKIR